MIDWKPGDSALCVDDTRYNPIQLDLPEKGKVYIVLDVDIVNFLSGLRVGLHLLGAPYNTTTNGTRTKWWGHIRFVKLEPLVDENEVFNEVEKELVKI